MLSKLKAECGSQFTAKLDGMLKDLALSDATAQHYRDQCAAAMVTSPGAPSSGSAMVPAQSHDSSSSSGGGSGSDGLELKIKVLTVGFWPANRTIEHVTLPRPLLAAQKHFESFYAQHYQGRRLAWSHPLSSCVLRAQLTPGSGRKELDCPFFMALCLLAFNGPTNATLPESSAFSSSSRPSSSSSSSSAGMAIESSEGQGNVNGSSKSSAGTPGIPTVRRTLNEVSARLPYIDSAPRLYSVISKSREMLHILDISFFLFAG